MLTHYHPVVHDASLLHMEILTIHQARQQLISWESWYSNRDFLVRQAFASGVPKAEIFRLTGISRSTIDRILDGDEDAKAQVHTYRGNGERE